MLIIERDCRYGMPSGNDLPTVEGITPFLASLLYARGATDARQMNEFLNPSLDQLHDPMLLPDIEKAVERIERAVSSNEIICIFGDYDADGICATSILARYLRSRGARAGYHIPSRHEHGYGMNPEAIHIIKKHGASLIITVDNGIAAIEEAKTCRELGMDLIVTDHHKCQDELPACVAVVAQSRPDCKYPNPNLCGAGVALKLVHAVGGHNAMLPLIPLAGLATIADIVPLVGENRVLAVYALKSINSGNCFAGLQELGREIKPDIENPQFDARDLMFGMIPRINAAGRMRDAKPGVSLFMTDNRNEARMIARQLSELNLLRREEEQKVFESALHMIEDQDLTDSRIIMLYSEEWNPGVVGIAASRISERFYRPAVLFTLNGEMLTGSARSIEGVDIFRAFHANREFFTRYGGHERAAGASLRVSEFEGLKEALNSYLKDHIQDHVFLPRQKYEFDITLDKVDIGLAEEITKLEPFGEGNPVPLFMTSGLKLRNLRRIGNDGAHLKAIAQADMNACEAVAYCMGSEFDELLAMDRCMVVHTPIVNSWRGSKVLQLRLKAVAHDRIRDISGYINSNDSKFFDAFFKNVVYNKGDICPKFTRVSRADCLRELLYSDITGALILCFTQEGAIDLLNTVAELKLWDKLDTAFYCVKNRPIAYNTVLFAPVMEKLEARQYKNILVYDTCMSTEALKGLCQIAPRANLFVSYIQEAFGQKLKCAIDTERSRIAEIYTSIYNTLKQKKWRRRELCSQLTGMSICTKYEFGFAFDVFIELGFIRVERCDEVRLIPNAEKRRLSESRLYMGVASLPDKLGKYADMMQPPQNGGLNDGSEIHD